MGINSKRATGVLFAFLVAPCFFLNAHGNAPERREMVFSIDSGNQYTGVQTRDTRLAINGEEEVVHQAAMSIVGYLRTTRLYEGHREIQPISTVESGERVVTERLYDFQHDKEHGLQYAKIVNKLILFHFEDDSWDIFRKSTTTPSIRRNLSGEELARFESRNMHLMYRVYNDDRVRSVSLVSTASTVDREDGKEHTHRFQPMFWLEALEENYQRADGRVKREAMHDEEGRLLYMKLDNQRGMIKEVIVEGWDNVCRCPASIRIINWRNGAPYESVTFTRDDSIVMDYLGQ
ncbi:MAG: hypothetical protein JJU11_05615 [Candidatus Sumerlaeia bacterium]|nr:hypothetical protein [Candidatus Sumerlaeia bacterium]